MKNHLFFVLLIFIFAGFLRLWQLGKVPVSMSDDEVRLVYNAYSLWETGKDINGNMLPLAFVVNSYAFNPVPIYLTAPFVGIFGLDMFQARVPSALSGILTVLTLYFLAYKLLNNKIMAFLSSLILVFSPWHLQLSRFAYEGEFALFFYTLGVFLFLLIKRNNFWQTGLSIFVFLLAFYSYSGTKIIFLPLISVLVWYKYKELNIKQLGMIIFLTFFTFASFWYLSKTQNAASYGSQAFFFQDVQKTAKAIELERRASSAPEILEKLYHNKLTYWWKIFINQYQFAFSPQYLFINQESSGIFSMWLRGQMYYIEAPFLFLGLFYLFWKKRKEFLLILLFLIVAPLPAGLGSEPVTYTLRASFMLPWLAILVGAGIYAVTDFIKNPKIKFSVYGCLLIFYIYLIGGYLTQYYFDWVKYGAKYYSKAAQDLAFLLNREKNNRKLIVVSSANSMTLLHYAFYGQLSPEIIQRLYKTNPIEFDNISFQDKCLDITKNDPRNLISENSLYLIPSECFLNFKKSKYLKKPTYIIKSLDEEDEWLVYEK